MKKHTLFLLLVLPFFLEAQDVTQFGNKGNYSISGRINLGMNAYSYSGEGTARYAPFGYMISGGINAQLGPINIPANFSINHMNGSISSPFNLYGASPYYKWIKLHLGNRSLNFSPYVYSGRNFLGAGVELTPGKVNITAFSGKMRNIYAFQDTLVNGGIILPSYDRRISGAKIGFGTRNNKFELMGIKVKDEEIDSNQDLFGDPTENLVLGASANFRIFKRIRLSLNTSASLFTGDQLASDPREEISALESNLETVFDPNITTRASFAGDASIAYAYRGYKVGVKYKRIDPYYYSLGTNYLQNDIENYTLNGSLPFLRRRLRIRGSIGWQKDNLSGQKAFTSNRIIGSAMATYLPNQDFNVMFRYANYQHENQSGLVAVNDTLKILTTTHTLNLSSQFQFLKTEEYNSKFHLTLFRNQVVDEAALGERDGNFSGNGISSKITFSHERFAVSGGPIFNFTNYEFSSFNQGRIGGGLFVSKSFFDKKLHTNAQIVIHQNQYDSKANGKIKTYSIRTRYNINKSHNLNFRLFYLDNVTILSDSYSELRFNLNYGYVLR